MPESSCQWKLRWEWPGLIENIRDDVQEVMLRFFPDEESEDEE
jgi:hypothetical protein